MNQVIARPGRNTLCELAPMVRRQVPARVFFRLWADRNFHAIQRPVIGSKGGAKDQGVGLFCFALIFFFSCLFFGCLWLVRPLLLIGFLRAGHPRELQNGPAAGPPSPPAPLPNSCLPRP